MATQGFACDFTAKHGSGQVRVSRFRIEVSVSGVIVNDFAAGVDHAEGQHLLEGLSAELTDAYLDDIVGRATNENIALYSMYSLRTLDPASVTVWQEDLFFAKVEREDLAAADYPAGLFTKRARSYLRRQSPEAALRCVAQAFELGVTSPENYILRGRCHRYMQRWDLAEHDFRSAIQMAPECGEAYRNLGNACLYLGKHREMISAFDRAVELLPDSALAINNRGYGHLQVGNPAKALKDHEAAVAIDPLYAEAFRDMAEALDRLNRHEESRDALQRAIQLEKTGMDRYANNAMY